MPPTTADELLGVLERAGWIVSTQGAPPRSDRVRMWCGCSTQHQTWVQKEQNPKEYELAYDRLVRATCLNNQGKEGQL